MRNSILTIFLSAFVLTGCSNAEQPAGGVSMSIQNKNLQTATFAGGCFWCMEPPFENLDGVVEVILGHLLPE